MMLIEPESVREIDAACIQSGIPGFRLMTAAGLAVAASALRHFPGAQRFPVLAGPGNNGGDAYIAAGALKEAGAEVEIFQLKPGRPSTKDAARALAECGIAPQPMDAYEPMEGDVVIDGLFGAGLSRNVPSELAALISKMKHLCIPVLAIDLPSGIDGRTGQVLGAALKADVTVTFMALKPGMLLLPGREHCGRVEIAEIGITKRLIEAHQSNVRVNGPEIWARYRDHDASAHKYTRGALIVFSGAAAHTGAARLTANAGLRTGAGLVTIASPPDAMEVNATQLTAIMLREINDLEALEEWLKDKRLGTFVLGPGFGIGQKAREFALALEDRKLVLDADGITSFKDGSDVLFRAFSGSEPRLVLTPHEGEFSRLFADIAADTKLSKVDKAIAAAKRANAAVIYKGSDTVIASPDGRAAINTNAPPSLATAGSGDVLAGICGALLAQGYPVYEAACGAVWHHGEAANRAGEGLTAETLVEQVRT
jgi:hydroxyethylthiazole kinase-like uncharacterized protein yjeF